MSAILNRVYDLRPTLHTTDYYSAALSLMKHLRKRARVVMLSNLRDEDDDTLTWSNGADVVRKFLREHNAVTA